MDFSDRKFNFEQYKAFFWAQFDLAEQSDEIELAAEKFFDAIHEDVLPLAALVTVLNHKCWYWYDNNEEDLSKIYSDLYYKYNDNAWDWLEKNGTDEERHWYFETLD